LATVTFGTATTTTLTALPFSRGLNMSDADIATIAESILNDKNSTHPIVPGAWARTGLLFLPDNRGVIKAKPGDYVAVDSTGWPILISANAAASASWVHT
jgi:hypothetical protein